MNETFMKEKPVLPLLLSMALPNVVSMLVNSLYNIVDSLFVARISEDAMTALSLVFPIQNFSNAIAIGFGIGINAMIALYLGAGDREKAEIAATHGFVLSLVHGVVMMAVSIAIMPGFLRRFTQDEELIAAGITYSTIVFLFLVVNMVSLAFEKIFQAVGRMKVSMVALITGCVCNILLDPVLIFGLGPFPRMEVAGAAAATVLGQIVAAVLAVLFNLTCNHDIHPTLRGLRPNGPVIRNIYSVGAPSIILNSIGSVMTFGMNKILIGFTSTAAAVFGVYFKLQSFVFMPVFGLNNGMVPIIGFNYGARKPDRLMKTMRLAVTYAVSIMIIGMILFWAFTPQLLAIFNASAQMLSIGIPALRIISLSFLLAGFDIIIISVMQALGHGVISLIISILRQLAVLLPAAFIFSKIWGLNTVWIAFPLAECVALTVTILFWRKVYRNEIQPLYNAER